MSFGCSDDTTKSGVNNGPGNNGPGNNGPGNNGPGNNGPGNNGNNGSDDGRFQFSKIEHGNADNVDLAFGDKVYAAFYDGGGTIFVSDETQTLRSFTAAAETDANGVLVDANADGDVFVAFETTEGVMVASAAGDDWVIEQVSDRTRTMLALAVNGPRVAVATASSSVTIDVRENDGQWTTHIVSDEPPLGVTGLSLAWDDETLFLAWQETGEGGGLNLTTVIGDSIQTVRLKDNGFSASFARNIAISIGSKTFIAFGDAEQLAVGEVTGDIWVPLPIIDPGGFFGIHHDISLTQIDGNPITVYSSDDTLFLAEWKNTAWDIQPLHGQCDRTFADVLVDAAGELVVGHSCNRNVRTMRRLDVYPAGYLAECEELQNTLCAASDGCNGDGYCFSNALSTCANLIGCQLSIRGRTCDDATRDPATITACLDSVPNLVCGTEDGSGEIPLIVDGPCTDAFID